MKPYNGHRSWNAWNVALWIGNVESLYNFAIGCIHEARRRFPRHSDSTTAKIAAKSFMRMYGGTCTKDGGVYNHLAVRLAMEGFME